MNIKAKKTIIVGINGSGKSVFGFYLAEKQFKNFLLLTPHDEDIEKAPKNAIPVLVKYHNKQELNDFFRIARQLAEERKIDGVVVDDIDTFIKDENDIKACNHLNHALINHRHYGKRSKEDTHGLGLVFMTRRPQNVPASLFEVCEYNVFFTCPTSDNIKRKLNAIDARLYEMVNEIPYKSYKFVIKEVGKKPELFNPIKYNETSRSEKKKLNKEEISK